MENLIRRTFEFLEYDIIIPCGHYHPDDLPPSTKTLDVKIFFDDIQILVYYHTNGRRWVGTQIIPSKKCRYVNPFCLYCQKNIAKFLICSKSYRYKSSAVAEYLNNLSNEVWDKVQLVNSSNDKEVNHEYTNRLASSAQITDPRVCNEEEFMALVAAGIAVKEEEIPIIKGLVCVSVDDDSQFLGRENVCSICLQELKIMDMEEDEVMEADTTTTTTATATATDVGSITKSRSLVRLPCEHVFHEPCVLGWLHTNPTCPYCRGQLKNHA